MARKPTPRTVQHAVLTKSRRRCAFCYYFSGDSREKDGQIAHIDRNHSHSSEDNLVFLCLKHHNQYDSRTRQSKAIQPEEARTAKAYLEESIRNDFAGLLRESESRQHTPRQKVEGISVEVYERRYPVYAAFNKLVQSILSEADLREEERIAFVRGVADALFLFGEEIDTYLTEVHRQAMRLRRMQRTIGRGDRITEQQWQEATEKEAELLNWFEKEAISGKRLFAKYLRLAR